MNTLPCEILQQIATWLLPRNQCRLALTSKWYYNSLYTPLLQWHARKASIRVPVHNSYEIKYPARLQMTVMKIPSPAPKVIIIYDEYHVRGLIVQDITNIIVSHVGRKKNDEKISCGRDDKYSVILSSFYFMRFRNLKVLRGCCRYVRKKILLNYVNKMQPLYIIDNSICERIVNMLPEYDQFMFAGDHFSV